MTATLTAVPTTAPIDPLGHEVPVPGPDLSEYRQVHRAMRIANDQLVAAVRSVAMHDMRRAAALHHWFNGYAGELRTHHRIEDELIFPSLAARVSAYATYSDGLAEDHHNLDHLLDTLGASLAHLASGSREWEPAHFVATAAAVALRDLLAEHLDIEDQEVLPMIEANFGREEYTVVEQQVRKFMSLRQAFFTVPWWMATVEPAIAEKARAEAPLLLRVIYALTRRSYARRVALAFA